MPRAAAVVAVTDYIDVFYNRRGRHSSFGYITPCRSNGSRRGAMPLLNPGAYEMADVPRQPSRGLSAWLT